MQESPGLKSDWFDETSLLSIKNLNISLKSNLSNFFQTGSNKNGR